MGEGVIYRQRRRKGQRGRERGRRAGEGRWNKGRETKRNTEGKERDYKVVFLKVWSGGPKDPPETLLGVHKIRTIFIAILRHYMTFPFSSTHKCRLESRCYMTCDDVITWMVNGMCAYVML